MCFSYLPDNSLTVFSVDLQENKLKNSLGVTLQLSYIVSSRYVVTVPEWALSGRRSFDLFLWMDSYYSSYRAGMPPGRLTNFIQLDTHLRHISWSVDPVCTTGRTGRNCCSCRRSRTSCSPSPIDRDRSAHLQHQFSPICSRFCFRLRTEPDVRRRNQPLHGLLGGRRDDRGHQKDAAPHGYCRGTYAVGFFGKAGVWSILIEGWRGYLFGWATRRRYGGKDNEFRREDRRARIDSQGKPLLLRPGLLKLWQGAIALVSGKCGRWTVESSARVQRIGVVSTEFWNLLKYFRYMWWEEVLAG